MYEAEIHLGRKKKNEMCIDFMRAFKLCLLQCLETSRRRQFSKFKIPKGRRESKAVCGSSLRQLA